MLTNNSLRNDHGVISVGVQCGGPSDNGIFKSKIPLAKIFKENIQSTYCDSIVHYAVVFRVAGKFCNWGDDKIDHIRRDKIHSIISSDIVVSQKTVDGLRDENVKEFTVERIRSGLLVMIARLKKDKVKIDDYEFFKNVDQCIDLYKKMV